VKKNRAMGRVIGWNATRTWDRVTWVIITVKDYYLLDIIRMRLTEVERFEEVGGIEMVW
jgi:hypothetical protein